MRGSIEKRGKGSYRLTVYGENDGRGHYNEARHRITVHARNKSEAEKKMADFIVAVQKGEYREMEKLLFRDLVREWWDKHAVNLSPTTQSSYESNLRTKVIPTFGHLPLEKIKKARVIDFFEKLQQPGCEFDSIVTNPKVKKTTGNYFTSTDENDFIVKRQKYNLSSRTIDNIKIIMNSIFSYAVYKEYISKSPMTGVKTPKMIKKHPLVAEKKDLAAIMAALSNKNVPKLWQSIILFALATGARRGEIAGLDTRFINLDKGLVIIAQNAISKKGKGVVIKSTKTGRERGNHINGIALSVLQEYDKQRKLAKESAGDSWVTEWNGKPCDFFFTPDNGRPLRPDSISQWWMRFREKNGLKHIRFHDLRHSSAALSIEAGEEMKDISERLGHSDISITADTYGYLFQERKSRSAELIDKEIKEILKMNKSEQ